MRVLVCMHLFECLCMCVYTGVCERECVFVHPSMCVLLHVCVRARTCLFAPVCVCVCVLRLIIKQEVFPKSNIRSVKSCETHRCDVGGSSG